MPLATRLLRSSLTAFCPAMGGWGVRRQMCINGICQSKISHPLWTPNFEGLSKPSTLTGELLASPRYWELLRCTPFNRITGQKHNS
jgi:hypothetical protein